MIKRGKSDLSKFGEDVDHWKFTPSWWECKLAQAV